MSEADLTNRPEDDDPVDMGAPPPTCASCHFYRVCENEECSNNEPHGLCYVHPPRWVGPPSDEESTTSRGVATWADHPACRFHPAMSGRNDGAQIAKLYKAMSTLTAISMQEMQDSYSELVEKIK